MEDNNNTNANPDRAVAGLAGGGGSRGPFPGQDMSEADDGYSQSAAGVGGGYYYAPTSNPSSHGGSGTGGAGRLVSGGDYFSPVAAGAGAGAGYYYAQGQQQTQGARAWQDDTMAQRIDNSSRPLAARSMASSQGVGSGGGGVENNNNRDGSQSELADTSTSQLASGGSLSHRHEAGGGGGGGGVRDSIAGRFELYGGDVGGMMVGGGGSGASMGAASSSREVFHDAPESRFTLGGGGGAGGVGVGVGADLPQPLPTPGSERSEFATPSPMSREEPEHMPRREL